VRGWISQINVASESMLRPVLIRPVCACHVVRSCVTTDKRRCARTLSARSMSQLGDPRIATDCIDVLCKMFVASSWM
jgi:hypothetical protein